MFQNLKFSTVSLILILLILFSVLSFGILFQIISLILLGAMIAYLVRPLALKIENYVKYETLSIFLAMALMAAPLIVLVYFTADQIIALAADIATTIPTTSNATEAVNNSVIRTHVQNLGPLDNVADTVINEIGKLIAQFLTWLAEQILATITYIPTLFTNIIILLFSVFYFSKEGDNFVNFIKDILPKDETFKNLYAQIDDILKSIMIVNVITAVILGLLSLILYYILGYPYILLLGIITGISEFIPVVGPWIVYGALGILDILTGNYIRGVVVIVVGWLIDTFVDMYLRPRLAGEYTEVHPLVFLVGFIFGALTLGLPGLFIGPLIVGITYVLYHAYRDERVRDQSK